MCDRIIAESGKECEYLTNFYDDDFIERSSIGYYQYLHSSLSSFSAYHANSSHVSDKPLLPKRTTTDAETAEDDEFEFDINNTKHNTIYQHPFWPSQSYLHRSMPKKEDTDKERGKKKARTKLTAFMSGRTKGSVSGKNSTIPHSLNELITDNFMLLPSPYIAKYDNFYRMTDTIMEHKLKLMGNYECIHNERQRFLRCTFTAKDKINDYLSRLEGNVQYSWKWNDVLSSVSTSKKSKYEHGWNSSWVLPLLQITNEDSVKLNVLQIVNKLLLTCDLYCLYYESPTIINTLKQWLFDLLSSELQTHDALDVTITSSLLNLTIHTGSISTMFDVFHSLLVREEGPEFSVNIEQISNKIESEIHYWYEFGCPLIPNNTISSFMHERRIEHQALYLHSLDALRNITYSNITTDGTYLYIYHRKFGLFKIGTGYEDTIKGKIYAHNASFTSQILKLIAPPGLSCHDSSRGGLGNAQITSYEKYGQRYYGGNASKSYQSHSANPSKDIMVTSLIIFGSNQELFFRSREMLNHLMLRINKETLAPGKDSFVNIEGNNHKVWVADIDRITSFGAVGEKPYLLALHSPVICKHKLATRQGICSYSITGKRSVPQRWTQIVVSSDSNTKYYICAACSNRCYRESGSESLGYKKTVLSATLPRLNANGAMFCDCGSDRIPAPKNKDKYSCVCVNKEYLNQLELYLDERLKEPRIQSEKWRDDLATNSKVDALDSVHKWYTSTIIDVDETSDRIRINYDGWSSRYDEWLGRYDARIQPHKTRAVGGRESGGIIGSIDQKGAPRQINQLSPVKTEFKVYILDEDKHQAVGHLQCAPIGNQYKNQLPSCYDFYSTANNIVFQWISNNQCGVKIHLAVYSVGNINKYLYSNHANYDTNQMLIQPNVYHVPYQPIIHRNNPLLPVTKAFGLTLMDVMSGGVCYDATNHCLWCYDPTFMIIDQIQCLPKPVQKLDDILESKLESLPPSPPPPQQELTGIDEAQEEEKKEAAQDDHEAAVCAVPVGSSSSCMPLHGAITVIVEQLSRLIEYETDHAYLIEINHAAKQELEKKVSSEPPQQQDMYTQSVYKKKRKYRHKLGGSGSGSGSGSLSPANETIANKSFQQTQESYNLGSGMDAILKYVKRLQCLSLNDLMDSLHAAQKLILFAHQQIVASLSQYQAETFNDHFMENMIKLRLYAFKIFMKLTKIIPLYPMTKDTQWALPLNDILDMISYIATKEDAMVHSLKDYKPKLSTLLLETQTVCLKALIHGMRFFVDFVDDSYDIWQFLSVMVESNHELRWEVIQSLTMIVPNQQIFDKLSDSAFHKDVLLFLITESFKTANRFIHNVLSNTGAHEKEYSRSNSLTSNTHLQILCVFHHKVLWKTFQCSFDTEDEYWTTFIEYIEYIFMETRDLLHTIESLMQNKKFGVSKLQQLSKTLSESPVQLLIPSIISFLSSPNMLRITWNVFNGTSTEDHHLQPWRKCNIHLNDLILIMDKFIEFCGIDTCNLSLICSHAKNRSNTYPMVLNSEHPWKCMQNKWYVIQDVNLSSLYLTFHPNSSTPNTDGELKIGLQQHHVASIPRTALDIHLRGLYGAWPILPIEIPTDRLYLRWHKTETPSFKPYVDLLHDYFNTDIAGNTSMWGFRMESYGLLKSSRTIYKQSDPTILKYGFRPNRLPFLVDIQTEMISLSKALGFNYMLAPHARSYRRNKAIPFQLFSSKIFESGWDGKTLQITEKVHSNKSGGGGEEEEDNKEESKQSEAVKEAAATEAEMKIYQMDYEDSSKSVARGLYRDAVTSSSNAYALSLWSSVSQNLMIPKSLEPMIAELRLPVLSALIRHLPLQQQVLFVEENANKTDKEMEIIKHVFMIGNNVLRWVLDNLMSEKKAFQQIEKVYALGLREKELQKRVTELTDEKVRLLKEVEEAREEDEKKEETQHDEKQDLDVKEEEDNNENAQQTKLNTELVQILEETETIRGDLMSQIESVCKTMQSFCHKYFSIYCEGSSARLGFNRSNLLSYTKFDVNEISQHLHGWITKCLESLLHHKPDLDICLSHFNRAFKNRIEIVLQMKWNTNLTLQHMQQFLCNDYYFCYSDNPVLDIHTMMTQRQRDSKHRVQTVQHLLELMDCCEQCNGTYPLALAVHVPPSPLKRWCYMSGLEGLSFEHIKELKIIFAKWLSKMLRIGDHLHQFTKQKVSKQQSHRQKWIKTRSPKHKKSTKSTKDKKEEKTAPAAAEPHAVDSIKKKKANQKSPAKLSNQQLIAISTEHFLDIYQIVLESISCAQFDRNDMNLLFETGAMQTLFEWESKMCRCQYPYPIPLLHKSDFMWNEILKVLHSCSEGVFQWIESGASHEKDDKQKQIALELSTNILSEILNRLHSELQFICGINEESLNEEIAALEEINKRKLKASEVKQWTHKRILTSHQCMLKYFQLLHRLSAFKTAYRPLTSPDHKIYCSYLTLLFGILCNHQYLQHDHHRIYSLCIQKLCNLLPTLNLDSFNDIVRELKGNALLSFHDDQSFIEFILKSIGSYLYFDRPSWTKCDKLTRTASILSESDKVSGYSEANRHGTYSLLLKIPPEINTNSFIKYLVPRYLNDAFTAMIGQLTNVSTTQNKKPSPQQSAADATNPIQMFVDDRAAYNDDDDYNEEEDEEEYEDNAHEDEEEEEEDDEEDDQDEYDEEEEEEEEPYNDEDDEHEPPRAFDAILAFEEFMSAAVSVSKLKANIIGIKSMFNAKNKYKYEEDKEEDETKIWLKKVNDSLKDESSAILYTGKLKHCYALASLLANNGAIVYIEKSRNIADRNENLMAMNHPPTTNEEIPLQSQLMWNYYFMNGLFKSLVASPSWFDAIRTCLNQISHEFVALFHEMDTKKETDWMNNDWSNHLVTQLSASEANDRKLKILLGMLLSLNNNYYGENSNIYKYLNRNRDHRNLFVGARVRVTCLNQLKYEGLLTYMDTKSREITILLDNFYLEGSGRSGNPLKPFEVIRLSEQHEIEIIDFLSDKEVIAKHTKVIASISLNIIQQWPDLLQKLQMVLKTWTKMNAMLSAIQQQTAQSAQKSKTKQQETEQRSPPLHPQQDTIPPQTPNKTKPDDESSSIAVAVSGSAPNLSNTEVVLPPSNVEQSNPTLPPPQQPALDIDASEIAMLAMAFEEEDGFDLAELQKAMALSMSVDPDAADDHAESKQSDSVHARADEEEESKAHDNNDNDNEVKDLNEEPPPPQIDAQDTTNDKEKEKEEETETENEDDPNEKEEEKEDEKQSFPSRQFIETCNRLQEERQQYQILFNLIQSQMLNIVHNTLLFCSDEGNAKQKRTLLQHSKPVLKSFADSFISMANTQASSSSNWQYQYEDSLRIYHDLLNHNYLLNEFNRHIATIMENDALKEEAEEEDDDEEDDIKKEATKQRQKQKPKRLTSEQMATVPYQPRYDEEEKMMIGMDGNLLQFPTKWNLRFLKHFIIHPQSLQIEYKENEGKSLVVTTNNKVPFVHRYYFEIKIIKLEPIASDRTLSGDKDGNLSVGIRSNWADFFVSNTGWKWSAKRRFLQFDTESTSSVLNTKAPTLPFFNFESPISFINDDDGGSGGGNGNHDDSDKDKKSKPDIIRSMCRQFAIGDYVDVFDDSEFIGVWKSAKITNIKSEAKTIEVKLLQNKKQIALALSTKNVYKKIAPFCSKCDSAAPPITDRDFNQATDFGLMRFGVGDYIGCGINQLDGEIYFTQNGKRFWGNKPTFNAVPLFDFWPAIEIRNANVMIEANFGQKDFEYNENENENEMKEKDDDTINKWKDRVIQYEAQLNAVTKQRLAAKRNKQELRSMAYARRLDIAESISAGGLLVGINQRQLLRGIEFNQDDPNRVVDWALNQENYESAFAELGPSKSEREIEAEEKEIAKKRERLNRLKLNRMKSESKTRAQSQDVEQKKENEEKQEMKSMATRSIPFPDYFVIEHDSSKSQKIGTFEHYDSYYDGVELDYGFNVCSKQKMNNILPIYYTQTVSDPIAEKWLHKVESRLTIHGMDRFTMMEILNRLRNNPHDTVALMQAREIDPGLEKCPIQRSSSGGGGASSSSASGSQSPMSPSKHIKRAVKQVSVTPELLKFGVKVHVKADNQSRIAMIRAKIWSDELENIRNSIGRVIYVDVDTKPKLALVLFENETEGKQERWWLPLDVLQIVILDYNSSTISPPNLLGKSFLHHMKKTSSSIAKLCLELLYNLDCEMVSDAHRHVPFNSIQNYQYYASLLYNPMKAPRNDEYKYAQHALHQVKKQQQREALNEIIDESLQQLRSNKNTFNIHMNPTQNALLIRQNAFHYKVSIGCDILIQVMTDATRKTKMDDALTIYGDMGCTHILYRAKLHELKTKIFCKSEIWISLTGDTELTLALSAIPRLMNLFLCPQIRDEWNWDLSLIDTLLAGYFKADNIAIVIASEWMLSISHVLKNATTNEKQRRMMQEAFRKAENAETRQRITDCIRKLQIRLRFYYSADIEAHPNSNDNLKLSCLHSKLLKHTFSARYFAQQLFEIEDAEANDHWYINAVNTIQVAQYFHKHDAFPLEFVSSLCCDYLFEEKEKEKEKEKENESNDNNSNCKMDDDIDEKETMHDIKEKKKKEEAIATPESINIVKTESEKMKWLQCGWNRTRDILLLNTMTRYHMELKFSEVYGKIGSKHTSISSLSQNDDEEEAPAPEEEEEEVSIPCEYRSMMDKILNLTQIKGLKASDIPESEWKLIIFYRCIILCEFNKNMKSFLSLIAMEESEPFYDLMRSVLPILFSNVKRDYFHRILDYTATQSAFRQPFDLQIDRILSMDSFSYYDSVLFQAHQVLLHTDSSRLRTPWSLGRGLRTETPFIIKLHDEPVEGDEGPFRAFFGRLVDELQHNITPISHDESNKQERADDINYSAKNEDGTPITLALLVPTPNRSSDLGDNREYFMFNPNLLYYLQSQSFYCLGRIIGISIRCCVPLHFDLPLWIWILIKKMSCHHDDTHINNIADIDIDEHMAYLKAFDLTSWKSLESIVTLKDDESYPQLLEMLNVSQYTTLTNKELAIEYPFKDRLNLVRSVLRYQLYTRFEAQIHALVCGISEIVPLNALNLFNEKELKLAICGSSSINLLLLKDHTVYRDGLSLHDELIQNFWSVVLSLEEELKPKFVDFIYAQKRLPSKHEFTRKNLRLQISLLNVENPNQTLPQSQTCFLNLQIPQYTTKESLKRNFIKALTTASGFYKESSE